MPTPLDALRKEEVKNACKEHKIRCRADERKVDYIEKLSNHGRRYVEDLNQGSLTSIIQNRGTKVLADARKEDLLRVIRPTLGEPPSPVKPAAPAADPFGNGSSSSSSSSSSSCANVRERSPRRDAPDDANADPESIINEA